MLKPLHTVLFDALWDAGVRQIYGIPGDFVLNLYQALQADARFRLIRLSHEPSVGFAADGAARMSGGLGVCCVTYGAGGLNMINAVGCAYAEESPLVILSGGPGRLEKRAAVHVHHEVKSFESQLNVYREVTEYAAVLDRPETAFAHIHAALDTAAKTKRPVYLEIPRDMVFTEIPVDTGVDVMPLPVDEGAVAEAAQEIVDRLRAASRPVLIVGVEVHRFQLRPQIVALAERLNVPVASSFLGRGVFPTRHPQFVGTYLGVVSPPALRSVVEQSDCVLLIGEMVSDTSLGVASDCLNTSNLLIAVARDVFIRHHRYQQTPIDRLVQRLLEHPQLPRLERVLPAPSDQLSPEVLEPFGADEPIKVRHLIAVVNEFLEHWREMPVVTDTGDCLFAAVDIQANEVVAPAFYATMGFAIPAALGVQTATGRRPLVLVGDGAFQMTGPEISQAGRYGCNPIVVLFNNSRWEMLQAFFPDATYNDTVSWPFARLAELWGGIGVHVCTPGELRAALNEAVEADRFTIIEVSIARNDLSPILRGFVSAFKQRVYKS